MFHKSNDFQSKCNIIHNRWCSVIQLSYITNKSIIIGNMRRNVLFAAYFTTSDDERNATNSFNHSIFLVAAGDIVGLFRKPTSSSSLSVKHTKKQVGILHDFLLVVDGKFQLINYDPSCRKFEDHIYVAVLRLQWV